MVMWVMPTDPAAATDDAVVIIVNHANEQRLTLTDVKDIYTNRTRTWEDGQRISIYNLPMSDPSREIFSRHVLRMSASEAAEIGGLQIRDVMRDPQRTTREDLLVTIVSKKHTAIGYCSRKALEGRLGVRIVATLH